ncbi:MAG TPA: hypothetical protein VGN83_15850 [Falsiroseomonas sp.]|jgi:hypothetical protein|nr:hypothetical protein [Falsiroseomonas sp.]
MTAQKTNSVPPIAGLAEAEAAAAAADRRWHDTRRQRQQALQDVQAGVARRDGLIARAKAGEVVAGSAVAEIEAAIRTAESTAALLGEALPALLAQVVEAEAAVTRLACQPLAEAREAARRRHEAAKAALAAAHAENNTAWREWDAARLATTATLGRQQLAQHAPALLDRAERRTEMLRRDQTIAEGQRREAEAQAGRAARQRTQFASAAT